MEKFRQYAYNTTIHGIRDFVSSNDPILKIIWSFFLLGTAALMLEQVYHTAMSFAAGPSAIEMTIVDMETFPTIHICSKNWYNDTQARLLNFTDEQLAYISLAFQLDESNWQKLNSSVKDILQNGDRENMRLLESQKEGISLQMEHNHLHTIEDMINLISWNIAKPDKDNQIHKRWSSTDGGLFPDSTVCHVISNVKTAVDYYPRIEVPLQYGDFYIVIGEDPFGQRHIVTSSQNLFVHLNIWEMNKVIMLNKPRAYCNENYNSSEACVQDCKVQMDFCKCNGTTRNATYHNNNESFWILSPSLSHDCDPLIESCAQTYDDCNRKCRPCTLWSYQISVDAQGHTSLKGQYLVVFTTVKQMKISKEFYAYQLSAMLGDVGGLISLSCGASVLSIVQLVLFWWHRDKTTVKPVIIVPENQKGHKY